MKIRNWFQMLRLAGVFGVCAVVAGCSLLTQDHRKAISIDPETGKILAAVEGGEIGDSEISALVTRNKVKVRIDNDRTGTRAMVLETEKNAITAYEMYHGLRSGGMAPADALKAIPVLEWFGAD